MRLKQIGSNQTEIIFNDGTHVFFSYETPVCVSTVDGLFVTENKYSNTTTKHINKKQTLFAFRSVIGQVGF